MEDLLYPSAGEHCFPVPWLSCMGAETRHTAGVAVAVPHRYTHDAAHGHTSFMIYRKKGRETEKNKTKSKVRSNLIQPSLGPFQILSRPVGTSRVCTRSRRVQSWLCWSILNRWDQNCYSTLFYRSVVDDPALIPQQPLFLVPQPLHRTHLWMSSIVFLLFECFSGLLVTHEMFLL